MSGDGKPDEEHARPPGDPAEAAMRARLDRLSGALSPGVRPAAASSDGEAAAGRTGRAIGLGMRVMSEFVAGIVVGAFLGWQLDSWLGTSPVLLIVLLLLGSAAGFRNVYRLAAGPTRPPGA